METKIKNEKEVKAKVRVNGEFRITLRLDKSLENDLKLLYAMDKREAIHGAMFKKSSKAGNNGYLSFNMWINGVLGEHVHRKKPFLDSFKDLASRVGALTTEDLEALREKSRDDV